MMLAIVALSATFLVPFPAARRSSALSTHKGRSTHLMLNAPNAQQLATPEESQVLGQLADLLATNCSNGEEMPYAAVVMIRNLASPSWGTRGLFVTLLTDERYGAVFNPAFPLEPALLTAIGGSGKTQLLTQQLAMSTATGSKEETARSKLLLTELLPRMMGLKEEMQRLRTAVITPPQSADKEWVEFIKKEKYGAQQRAAINAVLDELLGSYVEKVPFALWKSPLGLPVWATAGYGVYAGVVQWDPVFCPAGPTSTSALFWANVLTTVGVVGWVAYVFFAATAAMAKA